MTANQINYQKHLEDVRSHKVNEQLSERQTRAGEISAGATVSQAESARRNAETNVLNSDINRLNADAAQMSAMASQTMAAASYMNAQTERMYKEAQVMLEASKQQETARHDYQTEQAELLKQGETKRHNLESEWLTGFDTQVKSGISAADRAERAREADMSNATTKRGQNFGLITTGVNAITHLIDTGASLLKPFKAGFNAGKLGG